MSVDPETLATIERLARLAARGKSAEGDLDDLAFLLRLYAEDDPDHPLAIALRAFIRRVEARRAKYQEVAA